MSSLFDASTPNIYTIPAGSNFLNAFATALADETGLRDDPEALADALIYVPNRRSDSALRFALYQAAGGKACLLPDIRVLGDLETDEPPPTAEAALADLPPVISPAERIGALTRLVMAYFERAGSQIPAVSCLSAARELARLLDQAALSGDVDWAALADLAPGTQLAAHWEQSVKFLEIITEHWPAQLEDAARIDPYARRFAAAEAMAAHWRATPPQTPVIIAGSTGATPASRILMQAALDAPQGLIVLPGLDTDLDDETARQVKAAPSHPQHAMVRALEALNLARSEIALWPIKDAAPAQHARQRLLHEALAPAQSTADWTAKLSEVAGDQDSADFVRNAVSGLTVLEAKDETEEAMLAALMLRETLEHPGQTAALVTPDAGLARHVSAWLKRWDIDLAPSSGWPLTQTQAGSFILLVADWLLDPAHPVALMAMLQHSTCRFGTDEVRSLDKGMLRGPRIWTDWAQLEQRVADFARVDGDASAELTSLSTMMAEIGQLIEPLDLAALDGAVWYQHVASVAAALGPETWTGQDGGTLANLMEDLKTLAEPLGPQPASVWNDLLKAEATALAVPIGNLHPRLAIWGPLEARLQTADRLILAGLNEDVWPAQPPADAFLPRVFRAQIGLSDPDERVGLSAHDFTQLAAAPDVTLLNSQRREDKPAIASRWLWRLKTLVRGALGADSDTIFAPRPDRDAIAWLRALEAAPEAAPDFSAEPRPKPPLSARPKALSVTRVEQLVRDPYAIYCESVLRLRPLDPLNLAADARVRGTAIHKALEDFEAPGTQQNADHLLALLEHELRRGGEAEADLVALREKRREVCADYLTWRAENKVGMEGRPLTEIRGELHLIVQGHPFRLSGTADRIEVRQGGQIAILDFKTGKPPSEKQVRAGLSPQMPLQGLIAREGGYAELGRVPVEALTYVRFGTTFDVQSLGAPASRAGLEAVPAEDLIADAEAGLLRLITAFTDPNHPYLSAPRPERVIYESAYSRLARRDEWTGLRTYD
ncbi:MAG: double-strand break repair protein AddB [Pseudomonadota bacterium]